MGTRIENRLAKIENVFHFAPGKCPAESALRLLEEAENARSLSEARAKMAEARRFIEMIGRPVPVADLDLSGVSDETVLKVLDLLRESPIRGQAK